MADDTPTNGEADSGSVDSRAVIQNCIDQAQQQGRTLWIPQGTFYVKGTEGLHAQGIIIEGAGLWYRTVYRDVPVPNSTPLAALFDLTSCTVRNFHINADAVSRSTVGGDGGAMDTTGTDLTGAVDLPATGDWQSWATVTTHVTLPAGRQTLTLDQDNGGWNINHLGFSADEPAG
ncbi:carbohydrate-binding protein [Streptomyces sp. NPDC091215]|uniref:carbohydrate-binding protein n=1 Tax=Streptomyces sp. NPDC091215 TaxID=3155192 RepID=UPI0034228A31